MKMIIMRISIVIAAAVTALAAVVIIRTIAIKGEKSEKVSRVTYAIDEGKAAGHLTMAIQYKTISYRDDSRMDAGAFRAFHRFLALSYPRVHAALKLEKVNDFNLLYKWEGSDAGKKPILLMAHQDVVAADEGTGNKWQHPPFSGKMLDGYIWGRGALDTKQSLIGIFEAVEYLLANGFKPERTVYLAFGFDEEVGGMKGAAQVASYLKSRGVKLSCVIDEGGSIMTNMMPGIAEPVAFIGIAEKGYMTLEIVSSDQGGHSSMPPDHTAVGRLSAAICRLENNPFPSSLSGITGLMFRRLAPKMSFGYRLIMGNLWFFGPLVKSQLNGNPTTAATIRTTMAATMIEGGTKENILPQRVMATVNLRIKPGETIDTVFNRVTEVIDDENIKIYRRPQANNPSPVSYAGSDEFKAIERTVGQVIPGVTCSPYLALGTSDSRHYNEIADQTFRFTPVIMEPRDLKRIHGTDERIPVKDFINCITFYIRILEELQ